ncbi:MAG: hypothetical protein N2260_06495 [Syntrophobacterales bacterium]|nr:hypothetical protein [Syntrophobacterales bacterium]
MMVNMPEKELKEQLEEVNKKLELLQYELKRLIESSKALEDELTSERRLRVSLSEEIASLRSQLDAVYKSYSWRITYPLRLVGWLLLAVKKNSLLLGRSVGNILNALIAYLALRAREIVFRYPWLSNNIYNFLVKFPRLYHRFYEFYSKLELVDSKNQLLALNGSLPSNAPILNRRALRIYVALKRAIDELEGL